MEAGDDIEVRVASDEAEIEEALALRLRVFSAEQGIAREADNDGLDGESVHLVALRRGNVVATCRLRYPRGQAKIERMAVDPGLRRTGIGSRLVAATEREAGRQGATDLVLHAQREAEPFYAACGYRTEGDQFLEQGIPHVLMRKRLEPAS